MTGILYHCRDGRSFRPLWAMAELGLDCELRVLPFPPRLAAPDFLKENPLGTIPLFIDGATRMRESTMIGHYLAVRAESPLALAPDEAEYGRYLDVLAYGETTLSWPMGVSLLYSLFVPEADRLPRVVDDMRRRLAMVFRDLDLTLGTRPWIVGDRFTMADVSIGYAIRLSQWVGVRETLGENLLAYFDRLEARPAYKRAEAWQEAELWT